MERLERYLVEYCAPTLASLKTASLFSCPKEMLPGLCGSLARLNRCFREKGIRLCLLRKKGSALVYVYRSGELKRDLRVPEAKQILVNYGYSTKEEEGAIARLRERLMEGGEFPHEIGLFLGYPPGDVKGFIRYGGRCCKCTGCWKVYGDEVKAKQAFAMFERCKKAYLRLWQEGESIMQLAMAVPQD